MKTWRKRWDFRRTRILDSWELWFDRHQIAVGGLSAERVTHWKQLRTYEPLTPDWPGHRPRIDWVASDGPRVASNQSSRSISHHGWPSQKLPSTNCKPAINDINIYEDMSPRRLCPGRKVCSCPVENQSTIYIRGYTYWAVINFIYGVIQAPSHV